MTMPDSELLRLTRMPLQAFGQQAAAFGTAAETFAPCHAVLKAKRIPASRLRIFFSPAHDVAHLLNAALEAAPGKDRRAWPEPPDLHGREFRRLLRTWTPRSHVDVAVHPANLEFLRPDEEIVVSAPAAERDHSLSLAMLAAPLTREAVSRVMAALVTHLALAEVRGAAHCLRQKRLSRKALETSSGPQPAAPRRLFRAPNLRPALHRVVPSRRNLHFATA
jgi:hypothetical protein